MKQPLLFLFALLLSLFSQAQISNIEVCDSNNDGFSIFDLTFHEPEILDGLNANNYSITYHETQNDANTNNNLIANPNNYTNSINSFQTIYVRVEEIGTTNFTTTSFNLIVNYTPIANVPTDLVLCEIDSDGIEIFDLETNNSQIIGTQNNVSVTYYESQADVDAHVNPLISPYTNITNPQTIFAVLESVAGGCVSNVVTFNLIVNTIAVNAFALDMIECGDGNGIALFDLTINETQLTNGDPNLVVSYYESLSDAFNNINAIAQPNSYTNSVPYNQIIYIRVEDLNSGCAYVNPDTVLYLNVDELFINQPTPLYAADSDNDGFAEFNLDDKILEIVGATTTAVITFHETQADAVNGVNSLISPYSNIVVNMQTVFVRAESINGSCANFVTLDLITEFVPFQVNPATLEVCNDNNATGTTIFDLTTANSQILSNLLASDYTLAYYEVYDDSLTQINPITNASAYTYSPNFPIIYAGVTENATGEYVITTINLIVNDLPIVDFDGNLSICNGGSIILDPNTNEPNYTYSWNTGENTPTIVINTAGFYEVTVTNPITGCTNTGAITIGDEQAPMVGTPQDIVLCGTTNSVFDLTSTVTEIANGIDPSTLSITFHETQADASAGANPIQNPNVYTASSSPQTIFVAVYNNTQNTCGAFLSFNLISENCPTTITCGVPVNESYCYTLNSTTTYTYVSANGAPVELIFNAGQVENNWDELIVLDSDGVTNLNANTPYGNGGDLTGMSFSSSGNTISFYVDSDGVFSCEDNSYTSIDFTVDCLDTTTIPICNATVITPQDLAVDVNENTNLAWTSATGYVTGYFLSLIKADGTLVLDMVDVGDVLDYSLNTLDYSTQYFVTVTPYNPNGSATGCTDTSFITRDDPNVIIDCSLNQPVNTSFCYINNETQQYNFISNDGSPLYIVFNSGTTEDNFDELIVLDSDGVTNLNADNPYGFNDDGDLTGLTFTTSGDTATVYIQSDGSVISCSNDPIDFDVFCASSLGFIQVNAFLDANNDGVFNGNDTPFTNGFFTYEVNNDSNINTVNTNTGSFTITNQDESNSYDITLTTNTGYENCFTIATALFENITVANNSTVIVDFPVTEQMPCEDLGVYLIPFSSPRPGFNYWNDLVIENLGATTIASGTVTFIHDPIVNYVDATPIGPELTVTQTATGATVDFTNLLPGESRIVWFRLYTPPTVNLGEFVTSSAVYTTATNDVFPDNNVSVITQEVIGSYDPNDITESHGREIVYNDFITTDEYLYYTIRFQNIGTAEAINVRIENTVDPLLDLSTLEFIRATHSVVMMQNTNQLTWTFDNINLPAQSQDDYGSNGYVHFRIKPTTGYAIGAIIPNTAEIYFDFNAPVITNTFETEFVVESLSVEEFANNDFIIYPNPATSIVNIKMNNALIEAISVEIIDVQGKVILQNTINETLQINVKNLETGLYFIKLNNNNKQTIKKLIIE